MAVNKFIECSVPSSVVQPDNLAVLRLYIIKCKTLSLLQPFQLKGLAVSSLLNSPFTTMNLTL
jgi:hypothetical protein